MSTWPLGNRPDSLQIDFHYIRRMVGNYLGYGYHNATWDDEQNETVQEIIDEGIRNYAYPPILPPEYALGAQHAHEWSFMRPTHVFETSANTRRYPLPQNFERPIGDITYSASDNDYYPAIKFTSSSRLRKLETQADFLSYPQWAAYEHDESQGDAPQLQTLVLQPTPDATYELTFQYQAVAHRLTEEHPFPLGGQVHGRGYLSSCLAIAELRKQGAEGPMAAKFMQVLAGNVVRDQQRGSGVLGYNGNLSMGAIGRGTLRAMDGIYYNTATYNNTVWG